MGRLREYKPEDPLRKVCNVEEMNFVHRFINDLKGIGCRVVIPPGGNGLGARIIVDGTTDEDPIPDSGVGTGDGQIPFKPYDIDARIDYIANSHPFKFLDVSTAEDQYKFTLSPGQFLARGRNGENSEFPEVGYGGSGSYLHDDPAPTFTVGYGKDGYVVLKAEYTMTGGKAVWSYSSIYVLEVDEDAAITLPNDYLAGYVALMRVRRATGNGLTLMNTYVRSNVSHTKCNTHHHFWSFA